MFDPTRNFVPGRAATDGEAVSTRPQEWRTSRAGLEFDLHADDWPLTSKTTLHVGSLREILHPNPTLIDGAIRTLAAHAESGSVGLTDVTRRVFLQFITAFPPMNDQINETAVVNFRDYGRRQDGHDGNGMIRLRPFLARWHAMGFPGVSDALVERIKEWKLKSYERHARVNRRDPNAGPLEPIEQLAVQCGALHAYTNYQINTREYAIYLLLDYTGRRPEQLVRLKWKDLDDTHAEDPILGDKTPSRILLLKVPRIKGKRKWRKHFRSVPLAQDDWNLLQLLRLETIEHFESLLTDSGIALQVHDRQIILGELPMFPGWGRLKDSLENIKAMVDSDRHGDAIALLREDAATDTWEADTKLIKSAIAKVGAAANVLNRDGEPLHLNATRLRYTLESNLYRLGCPPTVRAHNLDHDTLASLLDYSKNSADRASRWSKATLPQMQRLASYFKANVVDREADAVAGDDPEHSRVLVANAEAGATCAIKLSCSMGQIPRCCYNRCSHFQPWLDGPHEAFLEELLAERDDFIAHLDAVKERATIEAADTLILSVAAVIYQCEERRAEMAAQAKQPERERTTK